MPPASPMKLLVIDQDSLGDRFLNHLLPQPSYQITEVSSSHEAVLTSQAMEPDVIIINLMQPRTNGWKVCHQIRQCSHVPILVLSVVSDPNSIARWLDAGADDFLVKPLSSEILLAHLQKLTRRFPL